MRAKLVYKPSSRRYLPACKLAIREANELGKLELDDNDLLAIKAKGIRTIKPNGEEINVTITV
jgi:hypothetical protein